MSNSKLLEIQNAYTKACAEYGHLTIISTRTQARMRDLESQIAQLDAAAGKAREESAKNMQSEEKVESVS